MRAIMLLLLGAMTNIAVAWASAAWLSATLDEPSDATPSPEIARFVRDHVPVLAASAAASRPVVTLQAHAPASIIDCIGRRIDGQTAGRRDPPIEAFVTRAGWPAHAVIGGRLLKRGSSDDVRSAFALGSFRGVPWLPRDLPYRRLWPGFAINTLLYATILWLLLATPFAMRRWRRIRSGRCASCGYPIGASDTCTECGSRVRPGEAAL